MTTQAITLIFQTPYGERQIVAKSGTPSGIRAALKMAGTNWVMIGEALDSARAKIAALSAA